MPGVDARIAELIAALERERWVCRGWDTDVPLDQGTHAGSPDL